MILFLFINQNHVTAMWCHFFEVMAVLAPRLESHVWIDDCAGNGVLVMGPLNNSNKNDKDNSQSKDLQCLLISMV